MAINYLTLIVSFIMLLTVAGTRLVLVRSQKSELVNSKIFTPKNDYLGIWVTGDGYIRHELLANGHYKEARGERESTNSGMYEIKNNYISYHDDTGFSASGNFTSNDTLYHAGHIFYREERLSEAMNSWDL